MDLSLPTQAAQMRKAATPIARLAITTVTVPKPLMRQRLQSGTRCQRRPQGANRSAMSGPVVGPTQSPRAVGKTTAGAELTQCAGLDPLAQVEVTSDLEFDIMALALSL